METKKITIKKVITDVKEVEIEIEMPYYSKNDTHHFKVIDDKNVVMIWICNENASIRKPDFEFNNAISAEPCTEQEFNEAFTKALEILSKNVNLLVSVSGLPEPEHFSADGAMVNPECYKNLFKNEI